MNNPDNVSIIMDEICEEMCMKSLCIEVCDKCPLRTTDYSSIRKMTDLFDSIL